MHRHHLPTWSPGRGWAAAAAAAACVLGTPPAAQAASAHAASGRWFVRAADADSSSVWFGTLGWASKANINWTLPTFTADAAALPTAPVPFSEPKFNVPALGFPTARQFTGYNLTGTGPLGSLALSSGTGSSSAGAVFYGADWSVTASGAGTYDVRAVAKDPWDISAADLAGLSGSTYSVYMPFSLLGGAYSAGKAGSGFGYEVTFKTAGGTASLLNVDVEDTGMVSVSHSPAMDGHLSYYLEPDGGTVPTGTTVPGTLISETQLQSLISAHLSGGVLTQPIHLGIVLTGLPLPTGAALTDGAVAEIGMDASAHEAAAVPEPGPWALMLAGIAATGGLAWRRQPGREETDRRH